MSDRKSLTHYIVQTASAQMPGKCRGHYRRVAVLEVHYDLTRVSQISDRARGCVRIVQTWERLSVGRTMKSAYQRALVEAETLAGALNAGLPKTLAFAVADRAVDLYSDGIFSLPESLEIAVRREGAR
ncbi:MAG: hypothetical protein Q8S00_32295 [Deltaproteobacteria bacterium]|nr:hypothetical protein [Deltaproteobacteria bacterium]